MSKEYNGWTNYATWRVNMEILGDIIFEEKASVDELKEITPYLVEDYARAFISQVNFYEIAKLINEEIDEQD
jgi:hypothetical protein